MKHIVTIILSICILFGCKQPEIKKIVSSYKNGNPEIVTYFPKKDDSLTYRKEFFYESGKQSYIGNIIQGKKDGIWTWWYENGNKKDQCKYVDGFYVDTVYHWYENGQLQQIEIVAGRAVRADDCCNCNGTIIRYDENGKQTEVFTSLNDKLEGVSKTINKDGSYKMETYSNDKLEGVSKTINKDGSYKMRTYSNDTLEGATIEYKLDSAKDIVVGQYQKGKETGMWKCFDKDSVLYHTIIYVNGVYNGEYLKYYPNGQVKEKATFLNGEFEGELIYYDEKGIITKTEFYKNGKLQRTVKK